MRVKTKAIIASVTDIISQGLTRICFSEVEKDPFLFSVILRDSVPKVPHDKDIFTDEKCSLYFHLYHTVS